MSASSAIPTTAVDEKESLKLQIQNLEDKVREMSKTMREMKSELQERENLIKELNDLKTLKTEDHEKEDEIVRTSFYCFKPFFERDDKGPLMSTSTTQTATTRTTTTEGSLTYYKYVFDFGSVQLYGRYRLTVTYL